MGALDFLAAAGSQIPAGMQNMTQALAAQDAAQFQNEQRDEWRDNAPVREAQQGALQAQAEETKDEFTRRKDALPMLTELQFLNSDGAKQVGYVNAPGMLNFYNKYVGHGTARSMSADGQGNVTVAGSDPDGNDVTRTFSIPTLTKNIIAVVSPKDWIALQRDKERYAAQEGVWTARYGMQGQNQQSLEKLRQQGRTDLESQREAFKAQAPSSQMKLISKTAANLKAQNPDMDDETAWMTAFNQLHPATDPNYAATKQDMMAIRGLNAEGAQIRREMAGILMNYADAQQKPDLSSKESTLAWIQGGGREAAVNVLTKKANDLQNQQAQEHLTRFQGLTGREAEVSDRIAAINNAATTRRGGGKPDRGALQNQPVPTATTSVPAVSSASEGQRVPSSAPAPAPGSAQSPNPTSPAPAPGPVGASKASATATPRDEAQSISDQVNSVVAANEAFMSKINPPAAPGDEAAKQALKDAVRSGKVSRADAEAYARNMGWVQ